MVLMLVRLNPIWHYEVARICKAVLVLALFWLSELALAHPPIETSADVQVTETGAITISIVHDALAWAHGSTSQAMSSFDYLSMLNGSEEDLGAALRAANDRFQAEFLLLVDGQQARFEVEQSPSVEAVRRWKLDHAGVLATCALPIVVRAKISKNARAIELKFPKLLGKTVVTVRRPGLGLVRLPLMAGEISPEIDVGGQGKGDAAEPMSAMNVAWRYARFGFEHILPEGLDHCLFVVGLFLLCPRWKPVLLQISAFTVAHTATLTLTSLNIVGLSASIVEPAIAGSIAFIAIENLFTKDITRSRYVIAFLFGLVHGMGVATAFKAVGFPTGQLVMSLASFTVGVEAGHVTVLAAAILILGWWRDKPWYRKRVAIPLSIVIAVIALFWVVQRLSDSI